MATRKKPAKASPLPTAGLKAKADAPLHVLVDKVVKQYESQAEAARQMHIGKTYLSRLQSGIKENPSEETLGKLGITRQVRYSFVSA